MKISFIIPAYNEEKRIADCLTAIKTSIAECKDTTLETEIIIVNNASTDQTATIVSEFTKVTVVDEPHKGIVWARHRGSIIATGDILANIDADTRMPKFWVSAVVKEFKNDEKLLAVSGPHVYYDLPRYMRVIVHLYYVIGYVYTYIGRRFFNASSMLQGGNFALRRSALDAIGGFDRSIEFYGEDTDIAKRVSKIGKVKWTFHLPMYSSGRRFIGEGLIATGIRYALNFLSITFTGKPYTKEYKDIRT